MTLADAHAGPHIQVREAMVVPFLHLLPFAAIARWDLLLRNLGYRFVQAAVTDSGGFVIHAPRQHGPNDSRILVLTSAKAATLGCPPLAHLAEPEALRGIPACRPIRLRAARRREIISVRQDSDRLGLLILT